MLLLISFFRGVHILKKHALACVLCGILLASCAYVPHEVAITAEAPSTPDSVGNGVTVALHVIDDRDDVVVGRRGGVDITANNIVSGLEKELKRGLEAKGFTVVSAGSDADAEFEARLRAFEFFVVPGFLSVAVNTTVAINVEAKTRGMDFDRSYRLSADERRRRVLGDSAVDQMLNAALSEILAQIMRDADLLDFLGNRPMLALG